MYYLPELPYGYKDLEPYISEEQLKLHHQKHHQAYVTAANNILEKLDKTRKENSDSDMKSIAKELAFNVGGIQLHNLFWQNMAPPNKGGGGEPADVLSDAIKDSFGSFARFKKEFTQAATSCEGSGWAALTYCNQSNRLMIMQIEKHNVNFPPGCQSAIMVLDVWEHAYYLDYKNECAKPVWDTTPEDWEWVMGVNLYGVTNALRAFVPRMMAGGRGGPRRGHRVDGGAAVAAGHGRLQREQARGRHRDGGAAPRPHHPRREDRRVSVLCPSWVKTRISLSERNRTAGEVTQLEALDPVAAKLVASVHQAVAQGIEPADAARAVFAAIAEGRFYILTHAQLEVGREGAARGHPRRTASPRSSGSEAGAPDRLRKP